MMRFSAGIYKSRRLFAVASVGLVSIFGLFAAPPAGEIVYMEGGVEIIRDGSKLDSYKVDIGFMIEEFDMVETGSKGYVEFALNSAGGGASVRVEPNTSFYFEGVETDSRKQTEFSAMAGSMAYKVKKMSGNESFNVRTESAVMGVRGTDFSVTISPEGSVLVACKEGKVAVADEEEGGSYYSEPGQVVEKLTEQGVQTKRIDPSRLDEYRSEWKQMRLEVFKRGAPTFIKSYGRRYMQYLPKFEAAYAALSPHRRRLEKYEGGGAGSLGTTFQDKSKVSPAVVRMRSILPVFEHVFFRLQTLQRYHSQGIGSGMIDSQTSTDRFFRSYRSEARGIKRRLSETYYLLKLYRKLEQSVGGGPSILDDPFGEGEGFGGGESFGGGSGPDSMLD